MDFAFVFVCQGGPIEPKAALLAATLRSYIHSGNELIAAIPQYPEVQAPSQATLSFLRQLDVRTVAIGNPVDPSYLYAHKIECFSIPTAAERMVFLDSDILCLREFRHEPVLGNCEFAARLTDFSDIQPARWKQLYRHCGLGEPQFDHHSIATREPMPLCFNSGVVVTSQPVPLYQGWSEFACKLNDKQRFPETRPFLDQISLPFAVTELGLDITLLTTNHHWSSAIFPIDIFAPPLFAHYHDSCNLLGDKILADVAERMVNEYRGLHALLQADPFLGLLSPPQ